MWTLDEKIRETLQRDNEIAVSSEYILNQILQSEMIDHLRANRMSVPTIGVATGGTQERELTTRVGTLAQEMCATNRNLLGQPIRAISAISEGARIGVEKMVVQRVSTHRERISPLSSAVEGPRSRQLLG